MSLRMTRRARSARVAAMGLAALVSAALNAREAGAQALFVEASDAFPDQGCGGEGCWTNHMRLTDLDRDGDLDAIFANTGGFFSSPTAQPLEVWRNGGAGDFTLVTEELFGGPVVAPVRVVAVGDVDGDGDRDIVGPSAAGQPDRLWIQGEDGTFGDEGPARLGTSSRSAAVRLGDVDGDGDLDLIVGLGYAGGDAPPARLYLNDGAGVFGEAVGALPPTMAGTDPDDVDLLDADGDFDLDVLVNAHEGPNALWINDGRGTFSDGSDRLPPPAGEAFHYGPTACDVDGDGDRDLLIDNIGPGYDEQVLINDGTGHFTDESARLGGNDDGDDDNGVVCLDHDEDGDHDVIVASLSSLGERLFENDGRGRFTRVGGAFPAIDDNTLWMEMGDVDGDGRLDAVTAQGEDQIETERLYLGTAQVAVDTSAPVIFTWNTTAFWPEIRFAVRDGATSDEGPRLLGADAELPNAESPVPATPMGGDLWRVLVPEESTELKLCATDQAGNRGCIEVVPGPGTGGGGPAGPTGTSVSHGSGVASTSSQAATGTATVGAGGASGDGGGQGEGDDLIIDRGCGCAVPGGDEGTRGRLGLALAFAGVAAAAARTSARRRSSTPPGRRS